MKVIALRPFQGDEGFFNQGDVVEVSPFRAKELERVKLAVPIFSEVNALVSGEVATGGIPHPTQTPPVGGPTGKAKPASSSPLAPAPQPQVSKRRRAKRK